MARASSPGVPPRPLILDAPPLSLLACEDRRITLMPKVAQAEGHAAAISTVSIADVRSIGKATDHPR
ncbi:hypothetical protein QFZ71_002792 [Streptomyces sp. V2I9]|nr:hypothetical protein [Streptomyces sp. V2I9]